MGSEAVSTTSFQATAQVPSCFREERGDPARTYSRGVAGGRPGGDASRRGLTPRGSMGCNPEIIVFPGEEHPLEKEMVTHSSILAWKIPWTDEPGGLEETSQGASER